MMEDDDVYQGGGTPATQGFVDPAAQPVTQGGGADDALELTPEDQAALEAAFGQPPVREESESKKEEITSPQPAKGVDPLEFLWKDEDEATSDGNPSEEELAAQAKAMKEDLEARIAQFTIPEDVIPENFNPQDPREMRDVIARAQQAAIRQTMELVFQPITLIMKDSEAKMEAIVQQALRADRDASQTHQALEEAIPIASDPKVGGIVRTVFDRALKKTNDRRAAIALTKKMLKELNVNIKGHRIPARAAPSEGGVRNASLQDFLGAVPEPQSHRTAKDYVRD